MIEMFAKFMTNSKEKLWIFGVLYTSNWFLLYASSRTLINTMETCLTNIALKLFVTKDPRYVSVIALCFMMRPTIAIFWLPLVIYDVLKSDLSRFFVKMLPHAVVIPFLVVLFDTYFYGKLAIVPWNFVNFNIINNISEQYGTEPWHWYLTNFLPALTLVLGIFPMLKGMYKTFSSSDSSAKVILLSVLWSLFVYSMLNHKEHRFLMPLTPLFLSFMAIGFTNYRHVKLFCCANIVLALYLSLIHQTGPYAAMKYLSSNCRDSRGILILTPCHGTPLYSHLHWNIPTKFLQCPPDLGDNPKDDNELFVKNPVDWLKSDVNLSDFDHIVFFDKWEELIQSHLEKYGLKICETFWHTHIPDTNTSPNLLIYCRREK